MQIKIFFLAAIFFLASCTGSKTDNKQEPVVKCEVNHPEWSKSSVIYEANIRQHTPEGTFTAFTKELPKIKELGVDIVWLMPVFPIGELHRKATQMTLAGELDDPKEQEKYLGSYYAIKDYMDVNSEFGSVEDFQALVGKAHELGMKVILDIAVNHTAWDHPWIKEKPDFYTKVNADSIPWKQEWMDAHPEYFKHLKELGMTYPIDPNETDWWDTADLNYDNDELREEMKKIFKYWITEFDIDGYRCDVAEWVPADFWDDLRPELDEIKPVFMLAEAEFPNHLNKAFDMNYGWEFHHIMNQVAKGEKNVQALMEYFAKNDSIYDKACYRMNFITNHDENSWNGTVFERLGDGVKTFGVLYYTVPGMPLIYSGQEYGMSKRLKFFEKDTIDLNDKGFYDFYLALGKLKKENTLFWNGNAGGDMETLCVKNKKVFAFKRFTDEADAFVILNLSGEEQEYTVPSGIAGAYTNYFKQESVVMNEEEVKTIDPWEYLILIE
ncbi:MAG: alpha amylase C-terminal domain-containing protein [Bacteroidales bacterium]|nr:alpha amylase C-terminal domain-containing protein [Bacteroidales bacterium]MBN2818012.1 alpha amylase C-terminal domain-containing protein [Bacteroidales bacterium]